MANPEDINVYAQVIEHNYGIRLTISEQLALVLYLTRFTDDKDTCVTEGVERFLLDYFSLDFLDLLRHQALEYGISYGNDLIGTKEFKEYCRRQVSYWREERGLI